MTKNKNSVLDNIEDAIADIKKGKIVIVVDDEDRENEGDFTHLHKSNMCFLKHD